MDRSYYNILVQNMEQNILNMQKIALSSKTMNEKMMWDKLVNEEMYKRCILKEFIGNVSEIDNLGEM